MSANLDLLRTCAVVLVVLSHLAINLGWSNRFYDLESVGRLGVAIFFVHTTLVLLLSLQRTPTGWWRFYVRRIFRIYPLAATMVLLVSAGRWMSGAPVDPADFLANLFLVQNLTGSDSMPPPLWSLPFEVQMYLVLPLLFGIATVRRVALLWIGCVTSLLAMTAIGLNVSLLEWVPCFLPGALAYAMRHGVKGRPASLFMFVAAGVVVVPMGSSAGVPLVPLLWVFCLALGVLIGRTDDVSARPFVAPAALVVTYSYGMYLTHWFALGLAFNLFPDASTLAKVVLFAGLLLVFSVASYRWIEQPAIALGKRLSARVDAAPSRASSMPEPVDRTEKIRARLIHRP